LLKLAQSSYKRSTELADTKAQTLDVFGKMSSHSHGDIDASQQVQSYLAWTHDNDKKEARVLELFKEFVLDPVEECVKGDLTTAIDLKSKYDVAHLDYDSRQHKYEAARDKPQEKREIAEAALEEARQKYELVKAQLTDKCHAVAEFRRHLLQENVGTYLQRQQQIIGGDAPVVPDFKLGDDDDAAANGSDNDENEI
jgi:BAR domain